jgi:hypothetical protein
MVDETPEESSSGPESASFDVVFRGDILDGATTDEVKRRVATSFSLNDAAVDKLFSGSVVYVKRNIDKLTAQRIYQRLFDAGTQARVVESCCEPADISASTSPANPSIPSPSSSSKFSLAPLGTNVLPAVETAQPFGNIPVDHLSLEPIGSEIIKPQEVDATDAVQVDTSHLSLE